MNLSWSQLANFSFIKPGKRPFIGPKTFIKGRHHRNFGAKARMMGRREEDNPHPEGSFEWGQWLIGHRKGQIE